ncbi:MAG: extracellular solute-binding protein [Treponema sp.]|nr:extracellular solute-binding protein [Treponema sp.]
MIKNFIKAMHLLLILPWILFSAALLSCSAHNNKNKVQQQNALPDLVIYSPHPTDKIEFIIREFRQRTGLYVNVIHGGTGELLSRLRGEELSEIPSADVFWGGGVESLESAKELFQPYISTAAKNIKPSYIDDEGLWTGFSVMTMVIVYNGTLVPENKIPNHWSDLKDPFFTSRIIIPDPEKSGSAYTILNAILLTSEGENWDLLRKIKHQSIPAGLASSSTDVHPSVACGEFFAGLTSEDAVLSFAHTENSLSIVYPSDGTVAVPDGVALVKNAEHKENAQAFIDFVLSHTVQELIVHNWNRRSVRTDIKLPSGAKPMEDLKILPYNINDAARKKDRLLQAWRSL